jgi:hypothetical protein
VHKRIQDVDQSDYNSCSAAKTPEARAERHTQREKKLASTSTRTCKHKIKGRSQPLNITQSQSINNSRELIIKRTNETASYYNKHVLKHNKINILGRAEGSGLVRQMALAFVCTESSTVECCLNKPSQQSGALYLINGGEANELLISTAA